MQSRAERLHALVHMGLGMKLRGLTKRGVSARSFERFAGFVRGREESLRRAYDRLDADGNGVLTAREVEAGLSHVCITCPQTRCQYRTRPEARPQHARLACEHSHWLHGGR